MAADNAHTLSDTLLIPYYGADKLDPSKDVLNFYLSQLCIQIKQASGLLVSKWRIFKKPLEVNLFHVGHIVQACAQLHNYCINNHDDNIPIIFIHNPKPFTSNFEAFYPPVYALIITQASGCASREAIRSQVASDGYCRPAYNISYNSLSFTSDNGKQEINF
jgi:hypothetical protein